MLLLSKAVVLLCVSRSFHSNTTCMKWAADDNVCVCVWLAVQGVTHANGWRCVWSLILGNVHNMTANHGIFIILCFCSSQSSLKDVLVLVDVSATKQLYAPRHFAIDISSIVLTLHLYTHRISRPIPSAQGPWQTHNNGVVRTHASLCYCCILDTCVQCLYARFAYQRMRSTCARSHIHISSMPYKWMGTICFAHTNVSSNKSQNKSRAQHGLLCLA